MNCETCPQRIMHNTNITDSCGSCITIPLCKKYKQQLRQDYIYGGYIKLPQCEVS